MARRTVKIKIPVKKPDAFKKLLEKILKRHRELGKDSPLNKFGKVDMKKFSAEFTKANGSRSKSEDLKKESENEMEKAKNIYGTAKGQTIETPGTLYNKAGLILNHFRGT